MYRLRVCTIINFTICENWAAALTGQHISFFLSELFYFLCLKREVQVNVLLNGLREGLDIDLSLLDCLFLNSWSVGGIKYIDLLLFI